MPGMDGLEAARRIRNEWPLEERPRIIAVTANLFGCLPACPSGQSLCGNSFGSCVF